MAKVIFYEKPGCINNTKQKKLLLEAGHEVEACNLLKTPWTVESLRPFFGDLPVASWFNRTAPRVKSGEVIPENLDEATALKLMLAEPLLIRRPLMQIGAVYQQGFDREKVDALIGLKPASTVSSDLSEDKSEDLEACPKSHQSNPCPS